MPDPTIIIGSLNDKELKDGIDSLVSHIDKQTGKMAEIFNSTIDSMKNKLAELGKVKVNMNTVADVGSSKRTAQQVNENKAVKETTVRYDQLATGINKATNAAVQGSKTSAQAAQAHNQAIKSEINSIEQLNKYFAAVVEQANRRFNVSPIQELRMQQHQLEAGMRTASENAAKAKKDVNDLNEAIAAYRRTTQSLTNDKQGWANRQAIQKEINDLIVLRDAAAAEQQKWGEAAKRLSSQYEVVKNEIRQIGQGLIESEKATSNQSNAQDRLNQKIQRQAELIKQMMVESGKSTVLLGNFAFNDPTKVKSEKNSIEEQVRLAHERSQKRIAEAQREITAEKQRTAQEEQKIATNARKIEITEEQIKATIAQQAELIRQRFQNTSRNAIQWQGATITRPVNEKDLSIEEQIAQYKNIILRITHENVKASQQQAQAEQKVADATNAQKNKKQLTFGEYESLRAAIASVLNVETQSIKIADAETASRKQLEASLKTLKTAYASLNAADRNTDNAKHLLMRIHELELAIDNIQRKAKRPISLHFVKSSMAEDTIDAIVQKIRKLQEYRGSINILSPNAKNEIKEVDKEIDNLNKKLQQYTNNTKRASDMSNALARSWNYMKNRLAFYFTVGASTQFVNNLIKIRSEYEMNERALGILIGSAEYGTKVFQELSNMALVSPYTLIELSAAAKQLTAYDIAARDVVDTTRRLADMAAAVGIPIERLTYALGQIKAYGYLNSRDARMFANAGIPLVKELSNHYTELEGRMVSIGDIYDRIKKKAIGFEDVMSVITRMTDEGGSFFNFQAKMADTLKVRLANLTLAWNNMLNEIGQSNQGVLVSFIGSLRTLFANWKNIEKAIYAVASAYGVVKAAQIAYIAYTQKVGVAVAAADVASKRLLDGFYSLKNGIRALITSPVTWFTAVAMLLTSVAINAYEARKAISEFNNKIREGAADNLKNIKEYLEQYKELRDSLYVYAKDESTGRATQVGTQDINEIEAKKAWEAMREQIELTTQSSDVYLQKLMQISNVSERLRQGFKILETAQVVNAAMSETTGNTFRGEDIAEALKDYSKALNQCRDDWGDLTTATERGGVAAAEDLAKLTSRSNDLDEAIKRANESISKFLSDKEWNFDPEKIQEVYNIVTQKAIEGNEGGSPEEAFALQERIEEMKNKAIMDALKVRIADEQAALEVEREENARKDIQANLDSLNQQLKDEEEFGGRRRAHWNDFTKWMSEQHRSEVEAMFRGMDEEQIKSLNFQSGQYGDFVKRMVTKYAKDHKMSYDEAFRYLKSWVQNANQWSIFLKLIISTDGAGSALETLKKYDSLIDQADDAIERLTKRQQQLQNQTSRTTEEQKELAKVNTELADAEKQKADAEAKGGVGKKAEKDAKAAARESAKRDRAAAAARKKQDRAAAAAQRQAETELQKTLKNELSLIDKIRSAYQSLTKEGASHTEAVKAAIKGYGSTVESINKVFAKWGLAKFDPSKFAGISNPQEIINMLQAQLDKLLATGRAKPAEIKDLQVKINDLELDAKKFNLKKISEGLNNELTKLKDEYELAIEFDANPELGETFANLLGIDTSNLPKTVEDYADEYLKHLNKYLKDVGSDVQLPTMEISNEELAGYEEMTKTLRLTSEQFEIIKKGVFEIRDLRKKDISEQMSAWQTLLEKYSEYEYKVSEIHRKAAEERKKADKANAPQWVYDAINNREKRDVAQLNFDEFQKTQTWITATGDLAGLTDNALGLLINRLEEYKKSAKNLDPKQIQKINKALKNLQKQQRGSNPFKMLGNAIAKAKDRMEDYQVQIDETVNEIARLKDKEREFGLDDKEQKKLNRLIELNKKLREEQLAAGEISFDDIIEGVNATMQVVQQAIGMFNELAQAIGGKGMTKAAETIKEVAGILEKTIQGASIGASFGGYGAAIGAIAGAAVGIITTYADQWSGNKSITEHVRESELAVKRLERDYIDLEKAMDNAFGTGIIGATKLASENKKAELSELKRQLALEKERKAKNRDDEKIIELETSIKNLEYEIKDMVDNLVNTLLGISGVSDAAESLMDGFVEALRSGEDAMLSFNESIDDMIATMVKKMLTTKIIQPWFEEQWNTIQDEIDKRTSQYYAEYESLLKQRTDFEQAGNFEKAFWEEIYGMSAQQYEDNLNTRINELENLISSAGGADIEDIRKYAELLRSGQPIMEANMKEIEDLLRSLGLIKSSANSNLSALQQGIQGITEDTAGALEAYMNGVSQQVYYQSDILTQIRDAVVLMNTDVQVATIGQILLQLQASYQVQMTIQSTLDGWSNPSGQAVRVEMI